MEETFRQQLRKKVIDLKPEISGSYTELYNLVTVMFKLTPDAFDEKTMSVLGGKIKKVYDQPDSDHEVNLPQVEQMFFGYKDDPNVRIKSRSGLDMQDVKKILDKARRDLLFYLAVIEDKPVDYHIAMEAEKND